MNVSTMPVEERNSLIRGMARHFCEQRRLRSNPGESPRQLALWVESHWRNCVDDAIETLAILQVANENDAAPFN